mmetsp:Transcript_31465/g.54552  ORF Transcript_31465/g.54552 Transcript_31465/m.54552 type:complete len:1024 (-) Transcript_31465:20-3091(-)
MKVQPKPSLPLQNSKDSEVFCPPLSSSQAVAALSPFGLLAFATRNVVRVYDYEARTKVFTLVLDCQDITAVSWRPEVNKGTFLAVGDQAGLITVVDLTTGDRTEARGDSQVSAMVWDWDLCLLYACLHDSLTIINFKTSEVSQYHLRIRPSHIALDAFGLSSLIVYEANSPNLEVISLEPDFHSKKVSLECDLLQAEFCPWTSDNLLVLTKQSLYQYAIKTEELTCLIGAGRPSYCQFVLSRSTNAAFVMVQDDSSISVWSGMSDAEAKVSMLECIYQSKSLLGNSPFASLQGVFSLNPNSLSFGLMNNTSAYLFDLELPPLKTDSTKLTMTQGFNFDFMPTTVVCSKAGVFCNDHELMIVSKASFEVFHRRRFPFTIQKVLKLPDKTLVLSSKNELYEYSSSNGVYKSLFSFSESILDIVACSKKLAVLGQKTVSLLNPKTFDCVARANIDKQAYAVAFVDEHSLAISLEYGVWVWKPGSDESYCVETGSCYEKMVRSGSDLLLLDFDGKVYSLEAPELPVESEVLDICSTSGRIFHTIERSNSALYTHAKWTSPSLISASSRLYLRTLLTMTPVSDLTRGLEERELPKDLKVCLQTIKANWMKYFKDDDDLFNRLLNYAKLIGSRREHRFWTLAYQSCHELMMKQLEPRQIQSTQSLQPKLGEVSLSMHTLREYETPTKFNKPRVVTPTPGRTRKITRQKTTPKPKTNENASRETSKRTRSMHSSPFEPDGNKKRSISPMIGREHPTVKKVKREGIPADNTDTLLQLAVNTSNLLSTKSDGKVSASVRNSMSYFYSNPKKTTEADGKLEKIKGLLSPHVQVVMRVYKACTIAASVSPAVYNDTLLQGSKLLEEEGMFEEASELLFLTGKGLEACLVLQNAGLWSHASKSKIGSEELSLINMRWAYNLMKQGRTSLSLEVALSSLHLNRVIQILELSGLGELAFSYACFLESRRILQRSQWHKAAAPYVNSQSELSTKISELLKGDGAADYSGPQASQSLLKLKTEFKLKLCSFPWLSSRVF